MNPAFVETDLAYPVLNSLSIAPGNRPDQDISVTIPVTDAGTSFVWLSNTQTTPPTAAHVRAPGGALPCSTTNYTFTGLVRGTYYGRVVAARDSYEPDVIPSTPAQITLQAVPVPTIPSNFATSAADMPYLGPSSGDTPYLGIQNVPVFLVGVPYTRNIGNAAYPCEFDRGDIHAYGFRQNTWLLSSAEPGTQIVYSGLKYDRPGGSVINQVVYKYFANASFAISNSWYIVFFTRTPPGHTSCCIECALDSVEVETRRPLSQPRRYRG